MAKAKPTAQDKVKSAVERAHAGNGRALAYMIGDASLGDIAEGLGQMGPKLVAEHWIALVGVLLHAAEKQAERDRVKAEKREAQRAARAALRAKLGAEYLGGVRT